MQKIVQFWNWFVENNEAYMFLDEADGDESEKLLNELLVQLHKYSENLFFEIGGMPGEKIELVITAEGNKDHFYQVEELIKYAPQVPGWIFVAFKPAIPGQFKSNWDGLELNTKDMWFCVLKSTKTTKLGVRIFLKNYAEIEENESLEPLVYKMLDTILGEKVFAKDIAYIDIATQPHNPRGAGLHPIIELPEYIEQHKTGLSK